MPGKPPRCARMRTVEAVDHGARMKNTEGLTSSGVARVARPGRQADATGFDPPTTIEHQRCEEEITERGEVRKGCGTGQSGDGGEKTTRDDESPTSWHRSFPGTVAQKDCRTRKRKSRGNSTIHNSVIGRSLPGVGLSSSLTCPATPSFLTCPARPSFLTCPAMPSRDS